MWNKCGALGIVPLCRAANAGIRPLRHCGGLLRGGVDVFHWARCSRVGVCAAAIHRHGWRSRLHSPALHLRSSGIGGGSVPGHSLAHSLCQLWKSALVGHLAGGVPELNLRVGASLVELYPCPPQVENPLQLNISHKLYQGTVRIFMSAFHILLTMMSVALYFCCLDNS